MSQVLKKCLGHILHSDDKRIPSGNFKDSRDRNYLTNQTARNAISFRIGEGVYVNENHCVSEVLCDKAQTPHEKSNLQP